MPINGRPLSWRMIVGGGGGGGGATEKEKKEEWSPCDCEEKLRKEKEKKEEWSPCDCEEKLRKEKEKKRKNLEKKRKRNYLTLCYSPLYIGAD